MTYIIIVKDEDDYDIYLTTIEGTRAEAKAHASDLLNEKEMIAAGAFKVEVIYNEVCVWDKFK